MTNKLVRLDGQVRLATFVAIAITIIASSYLQTFIPAFATTNPDLSRLYDADSHSVLAYQPTLSVWSVPPVIVAGTNTTVFASVEDKFGVVQSAQLAYSVNGSEAFTVPMQLIYGIPQNGTFAASLPPLEQGSILSFDVYVVDNLGYRAIYSSNRTAVIQDTEPPSISCLMVSEFNRVIVEAFASEYAKIRCDIDDNESGVAVAKFTENSTVVEMHEIARTETMLGGIYESMLLAPLDNKRTRDFLVSSADYAGNTNNATVSLSYSEIDENQYIDIKIQVSSVDTIELMANAEFTAEGKIALRDQDEAVLNVRTNLDGDEHFSFFAVFLGPTEAPQQLSASTPLDLEGQPWLYPFDRYGASGVVRVPFTQITGVKLIPGYEDEVKNYWHAALYPEEPYLEGGYMNYPFQLSFQRIEHVAAWIYVPLFAMFFLLGSIFVIKKHPNHLTNKLGISIGVFALIFSITEVIDSLKPSTSGIPTIADMMIFSSAIATIIYTIGGVFETHYNNRHIDKIAFIAAVIPIVLIFVFQAYPVEITLLVLGMIFLGLGYGVCMRHLRPSEPFEEEAMKEPQSSDKP